MITLHKADGKEVLVNPNHIEIITHDNENHGRGNKSYISFVSANGIPVKETPEEVKQKMDEFYRPKELPRCLTTL